MPTRRLPLTQRIARAVVQASAHGPTAQRIALSPVISRPGFWVATAIGLVWGVLLGRGRVCRNDTLFVARGMPVWAFGRGGTTIGAVYLTGANISAPVLEHEAIHRDQWRRYGLAFIPLYLAAGPVAADNRFEREAGLEKGGYR